MKRIRKIAITCVLSLSIILSSNIACQVEAEEVTNLPGQSSQDVLVTVEEPESFSVYSVDVEWKPLEFTYTKEAKINWNPQSHQYDGLTPSKWMGGESLVSVTNHSDAQVNISGFFSPLDEYKNLNIDLRPANADLPSAVGKEVDSSELIKIFDLSISGDLDQALNGSVRVGSMTIVINGK